MIEEAYVSFETAKLLKDKGLDWPCHATYDTAVTGGKPKFSKYKVLSFFPYGMKNTDDKYGMVISAPTLQMAMKWLREVHNLWCEISPEGKGLWYWEVYSLTDEEYIPNSNAHKIKSYEEAYESAIKFSLENLI